MVRQIVNKKQSLNVDTCYTIGVRLLIVHERFWMKRIRGSNKKDNRKILKFIIIKQFVM